MNTYPISTPTGSMTINNTKPNNGLYTEYDMVTVEHKSIRKVIREKIAKTINDLKFGKNLLSANTILSAIPATKWIPDYNVDWFQKDMFAGLTVAILLVPQSLAYSALAGLPEVFGLYASIVPIVIFALLSTSTKVAAGPVAATSIMVASAVEKLMPSDMDSDDADYAHMYQCFAMILTFLAGIFLCILGLAKCGGIVVLLTRPVMVGFITSAALYIVVGQFRALLGLDIGRYSLFYESMFHVLDKISTTHLWTTLLSLFCITVLYIPKGWPDMIPKWLKISIPLMLIVTVTSISTLVDFESFGINIIGSDIDSGFPVPSTPEMVFISTKMPELAPAALIVALVSYMGSIALAKGMDQKAKEVHRGRLETYSAWHDSRANNQGNSDSDVKELEKISVVVEESHSHSQSQSSLDSIEHEAETNVVETEELNIDNNDREPSKPCELAKVELDANQEFIAYGMANMIGSFFNSQVISASFSRTALNFEMNAQTQVSSLIQAFVCLLCLFFLMPLLSGLPKCCLASIILLSCRTLLKNGWTEFQFLVKVSRIELIEFLFAMTIPLIVGLELGIMIAIVVSIVVNLYRSNFSADVIELGQLKGRSTVEYVDMRNFKEAKRVNKVTVIELRAQICFTNNKRLVDKIKSLFNAGNKYIVVSLAHTQFMDTTALRQLIAVFGENKDTFIALSHCRAPVRAIMSRYENEGKGSAIPENVETFISTHDAVLYCQRLSKIHSDVFVIGD